MTNFSQRVGIVQRQLQNDAGRSEQSTSCGRRAGVRDAASFFVSSSQPSYPQITQIGADERRKK